MPLAILPIFLGCAFVAEVIGTMAGFGAATVLTPIAAQFMDIKTAVAVVACFHLFGNLSRLWFFGRAIRWRVAIQFGVVGVIASLLGAYVASWMPASLVRIALGAFLIGYVILEARQVTTMRLAAAPATLAIGGGVSGFIAGIIGTGGAIRSMCLLAFQLPKEAYLGTSAILALAVDGTRLPVYLTQGFIPASYGPVVGSLLVVAILGAWVGQRLVRRVSPVYFQRFVLVMLALMGIKLLFDGWKGMV